MRITRLIAACAAILAASPVAVGPAGKVEVPRARIDGTGRYLIPGLRDMHVHLQVEGALRVTLIVGVTGARVMAGRPEILSFRNRIERGELAGPDLYVAGRWS